MKSLTKLALKRPVSALLIVLAIGVFGIGSVFGFRLELTPEMEMPLLFVMTVYQGGDPERFLSHWYHCEGFVLPSDRAERTPCFYLITLAEWLVVSCCIPLFSVPHRKTICYRMRQKECIPSGDIRHLHGRKSGGRCVDPRRIGQRK